MNDSFTLCCYKLFVFFFLQAIVFRPFKGEVLDAVVMQVNKVENLQQSVKEIVTSVRVTSI